MTAERGSKKVEVYHLYVLSVLASARLTRYLSKLRKHAVETTETLDFLKELVQNIPDPSAGGTIDLEAEAAEQRKKRGKGKRNAAPGDPDAAPKRRRKKKADPAAAENARMDEDDKVPAGIKTPDEGDEDTEMQEQDDENEYDEDPEPPRRPILAPEGPTSSYRPRSPSYDDDDDWEDNKPYVPPKM